MAPASSLLQDAALGDQRETFSQRTPQNQLLVGLEAKARPPSLGAPSPSRPGMFPEASALSLNVDTTRRSVGSGCGERVSEALDEAPWEEARAASSLQGPLVPAIFSLLVHKDYVPFLQLNLCLALRRVGDHHAIPGRRGGEVQVQGSSLSVQGLQPHGPLHLTLNWAGSCSAMNGQ